MYFNNNINDMYDSTIDNGNVIEFSFSLKEDNQVYTVFGGQFKRIDKNKANIYIENFESSIKNNGFGKKMIGYAATQILNIIKKHKIDLNIIYGELVIRDKKYWKNSVHLYEILGACIFGSNSCLKIFSNNLEITLDQLIKENKGGKFEITKFNSK